MTCKNIRLWKLEEKNYASPLEAKKWLEAQSKNIRLVTFADSNNVLWQKPVISKKTFVDPTACLIGGMIINEGCYLGPYAVIRLDEKTSPEPLIIGCKTNIQDHAIIHSDTRHIGNNVIIAHQAVVHGAIVEDDVAIYIQAVVDGSGTVIGKGSFLHQGCYVGKNIKISPGRYVEPGQKVITQKQADSLPGVPPQLEEIRKIVLHHNAGHTLNYLKNINFTG